MMLMLMMMMVVVNVDDDDDDVDVDTIRKQFHYFSTVYFKRNTSLNCAFITCLSHSLWVCTMQFHKSAG